MWTDMSDVRRMMGAMDLLRSRMNRAFTDFDSSYGRDDDWRATAGGPLTNMYDLGDKIQVTAILPGVKKEDLTVKIQGNYLELSGKREAKTPDGYKAHRVERGTSSFTRSFTLPADVDAERVEAVLKDGILTMFLPKVEAAKPKQISIS